MTNERWEEFIESAQTRFDNVLVTSEDLYNPAGDVIQGTIDVHKFTLAGFGRFKVIRENKPVVLEKKMHYSHRQGDTARSEYLLSDSELSHKIFVYKENPDDDEWEEVKASTLGL